MNDTERICLWTAALHGQSPVTSITFHVIYAKINLLFTCPYYKSCDWRLGAVSLCVPSFKVQWPDKRKRRKRPGAEGTENNLVAKGQRRASLEAYVESMANYIAKDWQKCFSPTLKTYLAMGLESVWLWTWSCGQEGGHWCQFWEGCGKNYIETNPLFWVSTPWFSILTYPNYSLSHWSCFIALCIEET